MSYPVLINRGDDGPARHQFDARLLLIAVSIGQMTGFVADYRDAAGIRLGLAKCAGLGCTFVPVNAIAFSDVPRRCLMQPDCVAGSPGGTGIRNAEVGRDTPIILWRHDFALLMIVAPGSIAPSLLVRSRRRAAGTEANIAVALRILPDRARWTSSRRIRGRGWRRVIEFATTSREAEARWPLWYHGLLSP